MRIKDIVKACELETACGDLFLSVTNIDDVFNLLNKKGVEEIEVSGEEMAMIVQWYLANSGDKDPDKPEIIRESKVTRFLGVNIKLII
jgi:hypothetical protein